MTIEQVYNFYKDKRDTNCEITNNLISSGFYQKKGGYVEIAHVSDVQHPSQWWHLMNYCLSKYELKKEKERYPFTPCGELLFWMAEVSNAVPKEELSKLQLEISKQPNNRKDGNKKIKEICWDKIIEKIDQEKE